MTKGSVLGMRSLTPDDEIWLFDLERDPEVMRYTDRDPQTLAQIQQQMPALLAGYDNPDGLKLWVVTHPQLGDIGTVAFYPGESGLYEVGYKLGRRHWGQGLGCGAMAVLMGWVAEHHPDDRLVAEAFERNTASTRILQRFGFILTRRFFNEERQLWDQQFERPSINELPLGE
ncbi:Acetyltransferase (GNAT) domain-containing protein [Ferrimonas sediminum]|uniref:Acetyltransferase (GNAT) domain-containing protein n=2 Tax=Ferrimonas sediminum TaxID=718193 RepID=A0A1G8R0R6_9GAMM|nr:Acetyltransferase (GNAT) domain-containing protein [Ferrimonas sediminum]